MVSIKDMSFEVTMDIFNLNDNDLMTLKSILVRAQQFDNAAKVRDLQHLRKQLNDLTKPNNDI